MSRTTIGARPRLISSHSNSFGFDISARPIATICCWPPDSAVLGSLRRSASTGNSSKTRRSDHGPARLSWPPISKFSSTLSDGNSPLPSGTSAMPRAATACAGSPPIGAPSNTIASGRERNTPAMLLSSVLLPAPLAPITATASPGATCIDTPNSAWKSP